MNDLLLLKPKTAAKYDQIQCDHTLTEILKPPNLFNYIPACSQ